MSESNKGGYGALSHWETGRLRVQGHSWGLRGAPDSPASPECQPHDYSVPLTHNSSLGLGLPFAQGVEGCQTVGRPRLDDLRWSMA